MEYYPIQISALKDLIREYDETLGDYDEKCHGVWAYPSMCDVEGYPRFGVGTLIIVESWYYKGNVSHVTHFNHIRQLESEYDLTYMVDYCDYLQCSQLDYQIRGLGTGVVSTYELWLVVPDAEGMSSYVDMHGCLKHVCELAPAFVTKREMRRVAERAFGMRWGNCPQHGRFRCLHQVFSNDRIFLECINERNRDKYDETIPF